MLAANQSRIYGNRRPARLGTEVCEAHRRCAEVAAKSVAFTVLTSITSHHKVRSNPAHMF